MTATLTSSPCRPWCDHGDMPGEHESAPARLSFPHAATLPSSALMSASMYHVDDFGLGAVAIDLRDGDGEQLTPDEADRFADGLIGFASAIRDMARTVRADAGEAVPA